MNFNGFQKLTLLDFPGRVACTLFSAGCNFRCPFCHNASLVTHINNDIIYTQDEILSYLKKRVGIIEGVCFTGGEPLLNNQLEEFITKVKDIGYSVKLDTNGSFPDRLKNLVEKNLVDYVAMDIKNSNEKYSETAGTPDLDIQKIDDSVNFLLNGKIPFEFRTTVVKQLHEKEDFIKIGQWIKGAPAYFIQNFTDSGDLIGTGLSCVDTNTLKEIQEIVSDYVPNTKIRGI